MKRNISILSVLLVVLFVLSMIPLPGSASHHDKAGHGMTHSHESAQQETMQDPSSHSGHLGETIHESTVEGYSFTYQLIDIQKQMYGHGGMDTGKWAPKSHHLMVYVKGVGGATLKKATVGFLITGPDGARQKLMAMEMAGGYGADADFKTKGEYKIKTKVAGEGKTLFDNFSYVVESSN